MSYLGFIYNESEQHDRQYARVPNVWGYGQRGAWAGEVNGTTRNLTLRARQELELRPDLTAAVGFSSNWNRVYGDFRVNRYTTTGVYLPGAATYFGLDNDYWNTAPEASLTWRYSPEWQFRARYAVGYGTPPIDSLTNTITGLAPNTGLKAQTNMGVDGTVEWTPNETLKASVTFYNEWYRNENFSQVGPAPALQTFVTNIPASTHRGVETAIDWRPIEGWRFFAAHTYYSHYFTNFNDSLPGGLIFDRSGKRIPNVPAHTLTARAGYDVPFGEFKGLGAYVEYVFRSSHALNNYNTIWSPGYGLVNANLHYNSDWGYGWAKNFSVFVEGRNLIDTTYAAASYGISDTVTNGVVTPGPLRLTDGNIVPGLPRSIVAGVKVKF